MGEGGWGAGVGCRERGIVGPIVWRHRYHYYCGDGGGRSLSWDRKLGMTVVI